VQYREYGTTGKKVSLLGIGGARFIHDATDSTQFTKNVDLVLKAMNAGINYFDTAPTYASGTSEKILGTAFAQTRNYNTFVSTKSMLSMDPTSDDVRRRIEQSIKTLCVERITFFHMWSILTIEQYKKIIAPNGPYEGALKAKEEGLIEHICFSAHCNGNEAAEILDSGLFEGVTLGVNVLNYRHRLKGLRKAWDLGLGVAVMNPLAGGLLPQNPEYFKFLSQGGMSVVDSAIQFLVNFKEISTILIGIGCERDLNEALAALDKQPGEKFFKKIEAEFPGTVDSLCTTCNYCYGCPINLPVCRLMGTYNEYLLSNRSIAHFHERMRDWWGIYPFELFPCKGCGLCEEKCTQHLPIIERIQKINEINKMEFQKWKDIAVRIFTGTSNKIGIYGFSYDAEYLFKCRNLWYENIDLDFFDSNPAKWGKRVLDSNFYIKPPSEILASGVERIVIAARKYAVEIRIFLKDYVPDNIQILTIE
jgi:predicted aldo/keto reductase-like oxidoreductase